jgi:Xaa-Pro aminopeptidase
MADYPARIAQVRAAMERHGVDVLFLPNSSALEWLTGLKRELGGPTEHNHNGGWVAGAYLGQTGGAILLEPRLHADLVERQLPGKPWLAELRPVNETADANAMAADVLRELGAGRGAIAVGERAWAKSVITLQAAAPDAQLINAGDLLWPLRIIKDEGERDLMRQAARLTDVVYEEILPRIELGMRERDVAWLIERAILEHGAEGVSFQTGIRIGGGSAGRPGSIHDSLTPTTLERGTVLAFDFGLVLDGYCSDFGRTVFIGEPTPARRAVYDLVIAAQAAAIAAMRAGQITCAGLDRVARSIIDAAGHGAGFIHRLGHATGMDVHEEPWLHAGVDIPLETGMMFTIEPSIFMADGVFVRVEDVVMVTPDGGENFNATGHELRVLEF